MGPEREKEPKETPTCVTSPKDASSDRAVPCDTFSTCRGRGEGRGGGCVCKCVCVCTHAPAPQQ